MQVTVNGQVRQLEAGASVADLLQSLGLGGRRIALERNGEIVPKSLHPSTPIADGDRIEIVVAVGGG